MADLVIVSNRGPLSFRLGADGRPERTGSGGGLAGTLGPLLTGSGATWVAASMNEADRLAAEAGMMQEENLHIVMLAPDAEVYRMAYDVVSNATLWFCHHQLFDRSRRPRFDRRWRTAWDAYRSLNRQFADAVAGAAPRGADVLVQDYHLSLVGSMLAGDRPDLRTVHFSHTPFGDPGDLRVLPTYAATELLEGMAGFGACGFHTERWAAAFRACYDDPDLRGAATRPPTTFVAPLGTDPEAVARDGASEACARAGSALHERLGDRAVIVRVDRVELSKNILRGLWAFEELLESRPQWRERVVMLALAYPSREGLAEYLAYRSEVEHTAERINEAWGRPGWTPIELEVADDYPRSVAALQRYDVLLVNPLRDGMNLVAKEGALHNRSDGVLVISREAGAWDELRPAAIGVNPFDVGETADALHAALSMPSAERSRQAAELRRICGARTAAEWLDQQLAVARSLTPATG